jgi:hypothetical protein
MSWRKAAETAGVSLSTVVKVMKVARDAEALRAA